MTPSTYDHCYAYALGYFDARLDGVEDNHYDHADPCRHFYKSGYERGIADYCDKEHLDD
jgi:hypothetical protein